MAEKKEWNIFIGSSSNKQPRNLMEEVGKLLEQIEIPGNEFTPKLWTDEDCFLAGENTLDSLINIAKSVDLGVFIYAEDDKLNYHNKDINVTRANVVFEHGLFLGALGLESENAIVVTTGKDIINNIQSDYKGITVIAYDGKNINFKAKLKKWLEGRVKKLAKKDCFDNRGEIKKDTDESAIRALIVETFSKNDNRDYEFSLLCNSAKKGDRISVMGMGVTSFLKNQARIKPLLEKGVHITVLLMHESIIKKDWRCRFELVSQNVIADQRRIELGKNGKKIGKCPVSSTNIIIEGKHFGQYQKKEEEELNNYLSDMKSACKLCKDYKNQYESLFDYFYFYSFIPMSMTAIEGERMIVEYIIPFTKNRILMKIAKDNEPKIFDTFMNFFNSIKDESTIKPKYGLNIVHNTKITQNNTKKQHYGKH